MFFTYSRVLASNHLRLGLKCANKRFASAVPTAADIPIETNQENKEKLSVPKTSDSFCMNLFLGKAVLGQVFPYPLNLDDERREMLQMVLAPTEKFLEEVNDPFKIAEIVGANDLGLGVTMGAHQSIGYKGILLYGTPAQQEKYLPDLATGKRFAAFCLTEPSSGSDANSIQTRAQKSDCGKFYILNGGKIWISNGGIADVFTVFAQTPISQPDGSTKDKVSAFIVERQFGGVTNGPPEKKMGIKGSNTTEVHFDNVKIPVENLLGVEGEGFKVAIEHVNQRVQFGKKLKEFGRIQEILTDMVIRHYVAESITYSLASNMDAGATEYQLEAAIGKIVSSENAWQVCDDAIQLHGGMGFMRECGLERVLRDLRIFRIFEGANDILRLFVALTGMQIAGKHLQQIANDIFSGNISALVGEVSRRVFRTNGSEKISDLVHPSLKNDASTLNSLIVKFGKTVEQLLKMHRKNIIERQYELIRVANAAIDIYSMAVVLSRCNYAQEKTGGCSAHDQKIANLFCRQAAKRVNANLDEAMGPSEREMDLIAQIAGNVCENGAMAQKHPVDL
uniref:Very long-chain specific acyl-CoA dehydrogenase, mitochondrial n=1 Tax=Meloidogyne javanica TaxID=6303 RepID=A0A915N771_MELJA